MWGPSETAVAREHHRLTAAEPSTGSHELLDTAGVRFRSIDYYAIMTVVGKDVPPEEGMRVLITEEGRAWDINKAKRGDSSQGRLGSIVELREGGQVCGKVSCCLLVRSELARRVN